MNYKKITFIFLIFLINFSFAQKVSKVDILNLNKNFIKVSGHSDLLNQEPKIHKIYTDDTSRSLLDYLRSEQGITSVKDGCSGQAACGACTVEMNGKAVLSCSTPMKKVNGAEIFTIDGFPEKVKDVLASAFVVKGAIQCGFCTPGILTRVKILLQKNPDHLGYSIFFHH